MKRLVLKQNANVIRYISWAMDRAYSSRWEAKCLFMQQKADTISYFSWEVNRAYPLRLEARFYFCNKSKVQSDNFLGSDPSRLEVKFF